MASYDIINIQKYVKTPFQIVIPEKKDFTKYLINRAFKTPTHIGIKENRIYKPLETKIVQDILNLYTPNANTIIIDYNTNYYFSLMIAKQNFDVIYINICQRYNKFLNMSKIINNITFQSLNTRFKINKIVKKKFVPLLIVNDVVDITNSKRILNNNLHNILIIRDEIDDTIAVYKDLLARSFNLYKIKKHLELITDIDSFLQYDDSTSILAIAPGSKYKQYSVVFFD
tara:strand:+ start:705 stop:1388 length:684 start_codon:yes stop_codon:yes gene_type:complete